MYDVIIIGSGVAGLGAAVYSCRFDLKTLVIGDLPGGTITQTHLVENYPGYVRLSGPELGDHFLAHAKDVGAELKQGRVKDVAQKDKGFAVTMENGEIHESKTVIIATGTKHRELNVKGEQELRNKGVSYCATCDGPLFRGKTVAVVGGGDSAVKESLLLAEYCPKVYIIYRGEMVRPEPINLRRMQANPKIELILKTNIVEILGEKSIQKVKFDTGKELELGGLFIEIGRTPLTDCVQNLGLALNEKGEIKINRVSETNVPGIFAAGDVTDTDWKQAITGVGEGAHAANSAYEYIRSLQV